MVYYGLFFHSTLHTFSDLGWGPTLVRFVFIDWIYEHCGHGVILCLFFLASLPFSFRLHFASSHRLPVSSVSIISIHFASVFPCVMMMRSRPRAISQVCHTLHSAYRLWSRILRLKGPVKIGGLGFFCWIVIVWNSAQKKWKKGKIVLVWCSLIYLGSSEVVLGLRGFFFL